MEHKLQLILPLLRDEWVNHSGDIGASKMAVEAALAVGQLGSLMA